MIGFYGIGFWMPQVIQTYRARLRCRSASSPPSLIFFAAVAMVLWGAHSDRTGERIWHVALPLLLPARPSPGRPSTLPLWLIMVALTLATVGIYAAIGTFWSLPTSILTGTGAAAGLALINSLGNLGGLVGPPIIGVIKQATGSFTAALLFLAGALVLGAAMVLLFGYARVAGAARACHANPLKALTPTSARWGEPANALAGEKDDDDR